MAKSKITRKKAVEAEIIGEAKSSKTKRNLKKQPLTVRQRAEQADVPKKRVLRKTARGASRPFRFVGRILLKVIKPLRFLLWPFKTKPFRFVGNILYKIFFIGYFKNSWKEIRQVTWPSRRETWELTFAVFIFSVVFGVTIAVVDFGLDRLFRKLILER